jgi:hypothetical protein
MSKPWTVERVSSFIGLAEARPREAAREIVESFIVKIEDCRYIQEAWKKI